MVEHGQETMQTITILPYPSPSPTLMVLSFQDAVRDGKKEAEVDHLKWFLFIELNDYSNNLGYRIPFLGVRCII